MLQRANGTAIGRWANGLQTVALLGLMAAMGGILGRALLGTWGLAIAAGFALFTVLSSGSTAPRLVLSLYRARPVAAVQAPSLYSIVTELARRAELPAVPRLYLSPYGIANAMSIGWAADPAIVVTRGLLERLDARELTGVLAHEVAHVRNRDLWILGLADSIARFTRGLSTFGMLLLMLNLPLLLFGAAIVPFNLLLLLVAGPAASVLLALALSRTREFEADRTAAELSGDPGGLASALAAIERGRASLWDRLLPGGQTQGRLWRTHPAAEERIRRLLGAA
jgi:heat shock protein HtpX